MFGVSRDISDILRSQGPFVSGEDEPQCTKRFAMKPEDPTREAILGKGDHKLLKVVRKCRSF